MSASRRDSLSAGVYRRPMTGSGRVTAVAEQSAPRSTVEGGDRPGIEVETSYRWASHVVSDRTVLDVGCGNGHGAALLAQRAKSVVGVGWDPQEVDDASRLHGDRVRFVVGRQDALNVPSGGFEAVTCFGALENPGDLEPILAELKRALTDDGLLIASLSIGEGRGESSVPTATAAPPPGTLIERPDTGRPSGAQWQSILEGQFRNVSMRPRRLGIAVSIGGDASGAPVEEQIED